MISEVLQEISRIPTLRVFEANISLGSDATARAVPLRLHHSAFLALKHIHLSGSMHDIREVFECFKSLALTYLALSLSAKRTRCGGSENPL